MDLLLVRHAHAPSRFGWDGPDAERPLSERGVAQAGRLAARLERYPVRRVLSSPARRCVETVEPLARARSLTVESRAELAEGRSPVAVALVCSLAADPDDPAAQGAVVLCSHGDVIPEILWSVQARDRLALPADLRWAKGSTWVLQVKNGTFVHARYLPPPAGTTT